MLPHKDYVLPEVDLSHDEGDPDWDGRHFVPIEGRSGSRWVSPPGVAARAWEATQESWKEIVYDYEFNPDDFYNSWHYLEDHPMFWEFRDHKVDDWGPNHYHRLFIGCGIPNCVDVMVVKVNPETGKIDDGLNTKTMIWLEAGPSSLFSNEYGFHDRSHDIALDCGADTFEAAITILARLIWENYGNDRRICDLSWGVEERCGLKIVCPVCLVLPHNSCLEVTWNDDDSVAVISTNLAISMHYDRIIEARKQGLVRSDT